MNLRLTPAFLKQLWLTLGASLAFLVTGLVRGYSSSALPSLQATEPQLLEGHPDAKSWIGSIPPLFAFVGSLVSGALSHLAGRRRALLCAAPLWTAAWLLLALARSLPLLLAARAAMGLCVGLTLAPAQVYVSECCEPERRGRLGSLPALAMAAGILLSYAAGGLLAWRQLAGFSAVFTVALLVSLLPLPESPIWLRARGREASARAAETWLLLSRRAVAAVALSTGDKSRKASTACTDASGAAAAATVASVAPRLLSVSELRSPSVWKPLAIGLTLLFFQQYSGIDSIIFFTVEIFQKSGSTLDATWATVVVGVVQLVGGAVGAALCDLAGRRALLLSSAVVMCGAMCALGAAFYVQPGAHSPLGYLPVVSLVVFALGYSVGFGGVPMVLMGELFPARHRAPMAAIAGAVNLLAMFSVIKTYHALDELLTSAGTFWMYACFCALAFLFVWFCVPETRGRSLAEIETLFCPSLEPQQRDVTLTVTKM